MNTPIELQAGLVIGQVESVSPAEIRVGIDVAAPRSMALNTGSPTSFPRINGYVLIPNESGATIGLIAWIGLSRAPLPRGAANDYALVDLPFPERVMSVNPVATLIRRRGRIVVETDAYELQRGVVVFPSVGDGVLLPTQAQLSAIVGANNRDRHVFIGTSPMAGETNVCVDPDKLFGRHLAVLGNTGSGKSCSVAGLIRWSLDAAKEARHAASRKGPPNARFIVLDPNGEYSNTFADVAGARVFRVPPVTVAGVHELTVPAWLWNGEEWAAFAHAQPGAQRPLLVQTLRDLRAGAHARAPNEVKILLRTRSYVTRLDALLGGPVTGFSGSVQAKMSTGQLLDNLAADLRSFGEQAGGVELESALTKAADAMSTTADSRRSGKWFNDFSYTDLEDSRNVLASIIELLPSTEELALTSEDSPIPFVAADIPTHLESIAADQGGNASAFVATLAMRIRTMLADKRLGPVVAPDHEPVFSEWLEQLIGSDGAENGQVSVVDLSLVPSDVIHVVVAVIGRIVFESMQRHRRLFDEVLPTVLVLEEAHTFISRGSPDEESSSVSPAQMCRRVFERISREGRKFGLGLVLSSQRPSELSATALAQCNTFLLHRIVNDRDQELVARLVPDNLGGLLRELPSLPSGEAILLGWATPIPVLVDIRNLPLEQRPHSADPDFWSVWTDENVRAAKWKEVADDWLT